MDAAVGHPDAPAQRRPVPRDLLRRPATGSRDAYGLVNRIVVAAGGAGLPTTEREVRVEYQPLWPHQPDERAFPSQVWRPFTGEPVGVRRPVVARAEDDKGVRRKPLEARSR
jgi:hypothetical protein